MCFSNRISLGPMSIGIDLNSFEEKRISSRRLDSFQATLASDPDKCFFDSGMDKVKSARVRTCGRTRLRADARCDTFTQALVASRSERNPSHIDADLRLGSVKTLE